MAMFKLHLLTLASACRQIDRKQLQLATDIVRDMGRDRDRDRDHGRNGNFNRRRQNDNFYPSNRPAKAYRPSGGDKVPPMHAMRTFSRRTWLCTLAVHYCNLFIRTFRCHSYSLASLGASYAGLIGYGHRQWRQVTTRHQHSGRSKQASKSHI
jgi:hypothetical protein